MPFPFTPRFVMLEERGRIFIITLNRPKAMNSMPRAMHAEMSKVMHYFDSNDDLWVAIVTGRGRAFSAGFDLKSAAGLAPPEDTVPDLTTCIDLVAVNGDYVDCQGIRGGTGFGGLSDREGIKPVIAAVNGIAHGGGFETALACDIIIASEKADFSLPEPKVGLYAAAGGAIRLPRLIGYHNALAMILTGRRVKANEALTLGICSQVVPGGNEEVLEAALKTAKQILMCSPDSTQASLQVVKKSLSEEISILEAMKEQQNYPAVKRMNLSHNTMEGPRAFSEKRLPDWKPPKPLEEYEQMSWDEYVTIMRSKL